MVAGGGDVTWTEVCQAVRRGWTVVLVEGTGRAAEKIAARWRARHRPRRRNALLARGRPGRSGQAPADQARIDQARANQKPSDQAQPDQAPSGQTQPDQARQDSLLDEILEDGTLRPNNDEQPVGLARVLSWELRDAPVLKDAWEPFARYDQLAVRLRSGYQRLQLWTRALGVAATLLALLQHALGSQFAGELGWLDTALHWLVVFVPVSIAGLIAWANRLATGKRWVLVRAAAESIKREL